MSGCLVSLTAVTSPDLFLNLFVHLRPLDDGPQSFGGLVLSEAACDHESWKDSKILLFKA